VKRKEEIHYLLATHSPWLKFVSCNSALFLPAKICVPRYILTRGIRGNFSEGRPSDITSSGGHKARVDFWLLKDSIGRRLYLSSPLLSSPFDRDATKMTPNVARASGPIVRAAQL